MDSKKPTVVLTPRRHMIVIVYTFQIWIIEEQKNKGSQHDPLAVGESCVVAKWTPDRREISIYQPKLWHLDLENVAR